MKIYSPFTRGSSFELFLANNYPTQVSAADANAELINFWNCLKFYRNDLCDMIMYYYENFNELPNDEKKNMFKEWQKMLNNNVKISDDLLLATIFYIVNRCSFSGITQSGDFQYHLHPRILIQKQ